MRTSIGKKIIRFVEVDSTNRIALSGEFAGEPSGTVFVAEMQTGGVGRRGRLWASPKGGLYMSILLDGSAELFDFQKAAIVCGYSVLQTALEYSPDTEFRIKWPNDVYADGRKICGILAQSISSGSYHRGAIGIGVNLNLPVEGIPEEIRGKAVCLGELIGKEISIRDFEGRLLKRIDGNIQKSLSSDFERLLPSINKNLYGQGRMIEIDVAGKRGIYIIIGINPDCSLRVFDDENGKFDISLAEIL